MSCVLSKVDVHFKKINVPVVLVNVSGVNLNKFVVKHAPARKSEIREKLDLPPDKLIVYTLDTSRRTGTYFRLFLRRVTPTSN